MSLPTNNKNNGKKGSGNQKSSALGSKFIAKPSSSKGAGVSKKPIKTGGSRGS